MNDFTQIVLVGHSRLRLIEGIKRFPTAKLILLLGKNVELEGELKVIQTANAIELAFKALMAVKRVQIDKEDIFSAAETILNIIKIEVKEGNEVLINVSGSLRQMAIACYIVALVSKTPIYSVLPKYDEKFNEIGISRIFEIPFFPIKELSREKIRILNTIKENKMIDSIDQLITKLMPNLHEDSYNNARAKLSYHLKDLEDNGFLKKGRLGKKVRIKLTETGEIYLLGHEIRNLHEM
ncbi:MAG: HFX_2341 family transcriptional regulator domain-containing protein [Candidatus Helarchaeota archaeon]